MSAVICGWLHKHVKTGCPLRHVMVWALWVSKRSGGVHS